MNQCVRQLSCRMRFLLLLQLMYETTSSEEDSGVEYDDQGGGKQTGGLVDVEDIGKAVHKMKKAKKERDANTSRNGELREMVTPNLRTALTKQGV